MKNLLLTLYGFKAQFTDVLGIMAGVKLFYVNVPFEMQLPRKASQIELVKV